MRKTFQAILLFTATFLLGFSAFLNATAVVPHLREDMIEIDVRPTLLGAVLLGLHFGTFAMFAFAVIVLVAAVECLRKGVVARVPLAAIALTFVAFGILAFAWTGSHHALGYALIGVLIGGAIVVR
jgi:hypothetical protein